MKKVPVFGSEDPSSVLGYVSTNISQSEIYYSNELAFAEQKYGPKEVKLLDIASSQLSIWPIYNEKIADVDEHGKSSIDSSDVTNEELIKIYRDKEWRTVCISNKVLCEYLGLGGKISRMPDLDKFKEKGVKLNKKLFPGDKERFDTEHEMKTESSTRETFKPFEDVKVHNGYIEFIFNSDFIPYVIGVHGFKQYNVKHTRDLKLNLSLRLFKLINYYHHQGGYKNTRYSRFFSLNEFILFLGDIPNSYRTKPTLLFKNGVNPALEEIAKVSGIHYKAELCTFPLGAKGRPPISSVRLVPLMEETNLADTQERVNKPAKLCS
ncbi:replication initiation protein [Vibrio vulnificus]|nr:replication initiation protein [Vibrio vulnificus]